jgi:hypothetical protein
VVTPSTDINKGCRRWKGIANNGHRIKIECTSEGIVRMVIHLRVDQVRRIYIFLINRSGYNGNMNALNTADPLVGDVKEKAMKTIRKILTASLVLTLFGCATPQEFINPRTGQVTRNVDVDIATPGAVGINAVGGGIVGCAAGALLGAVAGDPAGGCALGAAVGGVTGAASTQRRTIIQSEPQVFETYPQQQGYVNQQPVNSNSQCTEDYRVALQEITAIVARKQQETANYLSSTNDREGAAKIADQTAIWQADSKDAILVLYQNCIAQITSEPQYAPQNQPQQVILQQPPVIYSQPAVSFPPVFPYPYYGYPYDYGYGYRHYHSPYHGRGRYGWR